MIMNVGTKREKCSGDKTVNDEKLNSDTEEFHCDSELFITLIVRSCAFIITNTMNGMLIEISVNFCSSTKRMY